MESIIESLLIIATSLVTLGAIILVHELGHFAAAKLVGIKVITFSVGFGRRLWQRKIGETTFCLSMIPLGGYVLPASGPRANVPKDHQSPKILHTIGSFSAEELRELETSSTATSGTLAQAGFFAKLFFYMNGLIFNVILAVAVIFVQFYFFVEAREKSPNFEIATVFKNSPAASAGLRSGDRLQTVNGVRVESWIAFYKAWFDAGVSSPITITVMRGSEQVRANYVPGQRMDARKGNERPDIGFSAALIPRKQGIVECAWLATKTFFELMVEIPKALLPSSPDTKDKATESDGSSLGFFGGMVQLGVIASANFESFAFLFLVTSVAVVLLNALPLPACDGSQVMILVLEKIYGKEFSFLVKERISCAGLLLGFGLMAASIVGDAVEVMGRWLS